MNKYQTIDYAILETLKVHPDYTRSMNSIIFNNLTRPDGIYLFNFTSQNEAREMMEAISQNDLLQFILVEAVKLYNAMSNYYFTNTNLQRISDTRERLNKLVEIFPYFGTVQKAVTKMANDQINSFAYYKTNTKELMAIVDAIINARYQREAILREYIDLNGITTTALEGLGKVDVIAKIEQDAIKMAPVKNIQVNNRAVNKCLTDVMNGAQLQNQHNSYGLDGTLFASQDIGKKRSNQEDSVLILTHPDNPEFKLLVVSDGMGGVEHGEKASQYTVQQLAIWFKRLPATLYQQPVNLQRVLNEKIVQISNEVYKEYNEQAGKTESGATIVASVVTETATITSSVGDSRIYIVKDGNLQLVTKDDSAVWPVGKDQLTITDQELDNLRFNKNGNGIYGCIGLPMGVEDIQTSIIENNLYDRMILLSDGVTDLLSQEQIKIISTQYPPHMITEELVKAAISNNAIRPEGPDEVHYGTIPAGKDNASAAMVSRR